MHPSLPMEILERVVDYCSGIPYTLCNLSLTCRQLLPRTRYHLFASIMIKGADLQRLYLFYDALNVHPKLGSLIRSVTFVVNTGMSERRVQPSLLEIVPVVVGGQTAVSVRPAALREDVVSIFAVSRV